MGNVKRKPAKRPRKQRQPPPPVVCAAIHPEYGGCTVELGADGAPHACDHRSFVTVTTAYQWTKADVVATAVKVVMREVLDLAIAASQEPRKGDSDLAAMRAAGTAPPLHDWKTPGGMAEASHTRWSPSLPGAAK